MSFPTSDLKYKAYAYKNHSAPIQLTEKTIKLEKQPDGSFSVPSEKILVKVHSMALNPIDLVLRQAAGFPVTLFKSSFGVGRDYSGTIAAIGSKAAAETGFKVGQNVSGLHQELFGEGTALEYLVIDPFKHNDAEITIAPTNLDLNQAAAWPLIYGTAHDLTKDHSLEGKKVLVLGAGTSVGKLVVQLAKYYKAKEIVVTSSAKSGELATQYGATSIIDYTKHKSIANPALESVKNTGKFDYVYDCCGNDDLFAHAKTLFHSKTHYLTISGDKKMTYSSLNVAKNVGPVLSVFFRSVSSSLGLLGYKYNYLLTSTGNKWIDTGKKLIESGDVIIQVDSVHSRTNINEAIAVLDSNKAVGKVVLQIEPEA